MNYKKPYFKDKRVRQAFIYGLERQKVIDTYFQGYASLVNVPITPVSWAYTEEGINKYEYNLESKRNYWMRLDGKLVQMEFAKKMAKIEGKLFCFFCK